MKESFKLEVHEFRSLSGRITEVQVHLTQNSVTAVIAEAHRRFNLELEPIEKMAARALKIAAEWLEFKSSEPVNLRDTGGQYVARS